jgi:hypothetical protein
VRPVTLQSLQLEPKGPWRVHENVYVAGQGLLPGLPASEADRKRLPMSGGPTYPTRCFAPWNWDIFGRTRAPWYRLATEVDGGTYCSDCEGWIEPGRNYGAVSREKIPRASGQIRSACREGVGRHPYLVLPAAGGSSRRVGPVKTAMEVASPADLIPPTVEPLSHARIMRCW